MDNDTKQMLKKVTIYDFIILVLVTIISVIKFKEYAIIIVVAVIMSLANFVLNALITNYMLKVKGQHLLYILAAVGRVLITAVIAVLLCGKDMNSYLAILIGYSLHYIAVTFYGVTRVTQKERR